MNFNGRGEHDLLLGSLALFIGERFQEKLGCLADIDERLLDSRSLRLAALQFRAPRIATTLVLFNHHADFSHHRYHSIASAPARCSFADTFAVREE